jgi:prepilin signal peptidase PulO-like enzyme (type II secretory pathway)
MSFDTLITLGALGIAAFGYTALLSLRVARRVLPVVPAQPWLILAVTAAAIATALAATVDELWVQATIAATIPILIVAGSIDSRTKRIPNVYVGHGLVVSAVASGCAIASHESELAGVAALAGLLTFVVFLALNIGSKNGFGMGDVKLGAVMVLLITLVTAPAWSGHGLALLDNLILATLSTTWAFIAFLIGGIWITARKLQGSSDGVPFGPFMVGAWVVVVAVSPLTAQLIPRIG